MSLITTIVVIVFSLILICIGLFTPILMKSKNEAKEFLVPFLVLSLVCLIVLFLGIEIKHRTLVFIMSGGVQALLSFIGGYLICFGVRLKKLS